MHIAVHFTCSILNVLFWNPESLDLIGQSLPWRQNRKWPRKRAESQHCAGSASTHASVAFSEPFNGAFSVADTLSRRWRLGATQEREVWSCAAVKTCLWPPWKLTSSSDALANVCPAAMTPWGVSEPLSLHRSCLDCPPVVFNTHWYSGTFFSPYCLR